MSSRTDNPDKALIPDLEPQSELGHARASLNIRAEHLAAGLRLQEFEILDCIASDAACFVYLAYDHAIKRHVSLKEYFPARIAKRSGVFEMVPASLEFAPALANGLQGFVHATRKLAQCDSPYLVKVHRYWEANGSAYLVMPYHAAPTLEEAYQQHKIPADQAWLQEFLGKMMDALQAVHDAHSLHRHVAPDNILLRADGQPLLGGFGNAHHAGGGPMHATPHSGSNAYTPIEQHEEIQGLPQGPWSDIYSLGGVVYFLITGTAPPAAINRIVQDQMPSARSLGKGLYSEDFLAVVDRMLVVRPGQRIPSVAELRQILQAGERRQPPLHLHPEQPVPLMAHERPSLPLQRARNFEWTFFVVLLTVIVGIALYWQATNQNSEWSGASQVAGPAPPTAPGTQPGDAGPAPLEMPGPEPVPPSESASGSSKRSAPVAAESAPTSSAGDRLAELPAPPDGGSGSGPGAGSNQPALPSSVQAAAQTPTAPSSPAPEELGANPGEIGTSAAASASPATVAPALPPPDASPPATASSATPPAADAAPVPGPQAPAAPAASAQATTVRPARPVTPARTAAAPAVPAGASAQNGPAIAADDKQLIQLPGQRMRGNFTIDPKTGLVSGQGVIEWDNGDRFEGSLVNGVREGTGTFVWANGNRYHGQFANGLPHGQGFTRYRSGDHHEGSYNAGRLEGQGRYTWADGSYWEGSFADNQRSGQGRLNAPAGIPSAAAGALENGVGAGAAPP